MEKALRIEINVNLVPSQSFIDLVNLIKGNSVVVEQAAEQPTQQVAKPAEQIKPSEQVAKPAEQVKPAEQPAQQAVKPTEQPAEQPAEQPTGAKVTLTDLRNVLRDAIARNVENRQAAKEKLNSLDADSLSTLDESKYSEMFAYLNSL